MDNDQEITFELDKSFAFSIPDGGAGFDNSRSLATMATGITNATLLASAQNQTTSEEESIHRSTFPTGTTDPATNTQRKLPPGIFFAS